MRYWFMCAIIGLAGLCLGATTDPFYPTLSYAEGTLAITFDMSEGMHIYEDMYAVKPGQLIQAPAQTQDADNRVIFEGHATFTYQMPLGQTFTLSYQGCDAIQCYMPQSYTFTITEQGVQRAQATSATALPTTIALADIISPAPLTPATVHEVPMTWPTVAREATGYLPTDRFLDFLKGTHANDFTADPIGYVKAHGIWWFVLLVFLGGMALNLTPCVLPMIPINLAIIGAGANGGSRLKGALRGGAYGLGIALVYGALTLLPILTGATFGAIQSSPWFNLGVAIIFIVLSLALFDVFMIDFARFSGQGSERQGLWASLVAGGVSALLAGACVAPVLIAVLLLTGNYFANGAYWALCLPFVLGLGMGLPWPIAGAGLSFLPKPGAWMVWVKRIFGLMVLLFAAYYAYVAFKTWATPATAPASATSTELTATASEPTQMLATLQSARQLGKPILLDFWGTACKNCEVMEATTFKAPAVQTALQDFTVIKVKVELTDSRIQTVMDTYHILGLPTYLILSDE